MSKNLENLIRAKNIFWSDKMYSNIVDLAVLQLTSMDETVRENYGKLLMNIPLNIVLPKLNKAGLISNYKVIIYIYIYHWVKEKVTFDYYFISR